jgi:VIT1/CCC1 family predicted Fe2+/Mn2+ transporter
LETVVSVITSDRERWLAEMLLEEHGITRSRPAAWKAAIATFFAFLFIGVIPLLAYFLDFARPGAIGNPFLPACLLTGISFALVGALKARVVGQNTFKGVIETLAIGAFASSLAYGIGYLFRPFAEGL